MEKTTKFQITDSRETVWTVSLTEYEDGTVGVDASYDFTAIPHTQDFEIEFDTMPTVVELIDRLEMEAEWQAEDAMESHTSRFYGGC